MKAINENLIIANAPSLIKKAYFDNLCHSISVEAETQATEVENHTDIAELEKRELDLKQ